MKIIGIDTSCDDTAIAVLEASKSKTALLSNVVSSQVKLHAKYGGVYPTLAKREHQKNLAPVLKKALEEAGLLSSKCKVQSAKLQLKVKNLEKIFEREPELLKKTCSFLQKYQKPKVDAIAVTVGPGLEPCLWAGVNFARALAMWWNLPIMPVNHLEAHLLANFLDWRNPPSGFLRGSHSVGSCPAVGLVVSGGHTELVLIKKIGQYQILGQTRDDAAGECFDKTARILGLGYPGGPAIARLAEQNEKRKMKNEKPQLKTKNLKISLPRPMLNSQDYDFSFSGLKTAVLYDYKKRPKIIKKSPEYKIAMAKEIQQAVIDVLLKKTLKAVNHYQAKTIILGGGVAANDELRKQFSYKLPTTNYQLNFLAPPKNLCTDNAAMVAMAAWSHFPNKKEWSRPPHQTGTYPAKPTKKALRPLWCGGRIKPNANLSL